MAQDTVAGRHDTGPPTPEPGGRLIRIRAWIRDGGRAGWPRTLAALGAGVVTWPAFPPYDLWWLAPLGVGLLTLTLRGLAPRTAAWLGFVYGTAFFLPVLEGIAKIGPDGWVLLSLVQALYIVPLAAGITVVMRLPGWPVWTAALWVAEEFLRGRAPFGGFPWARLAFGQTDSPLTPYAALGGAPLVTFLTALAGGLLAYLLLEAITKNRRAVMLAAGGVMVVIGAGFLVPTPTSGRPVTVAVIQGNVPRLGMDANSQRRAVLDNHVKRTRELADQVRAGKVARPELVIWPENSSDLDPYTDPEARALIDGAVKEIGVPVLVGAVIDADDGEHVENRGIVWDPSTGPGAYYVKRHPVPFGEYIPFRSLLTKLITRFERIPRDFAQGKKPGLLQLGPARIGDVICFEVAYDGVVRDVASSELLVVQTNNATYGRTSLPPQQIAMSRLRAVEHGRTVLVAATSGISAIVAPDGRMIDESGEFTPDIQVATVQARTDQTLAGLLGAIPDWALTLLALGAVAVAWRRPARPADRLEKPGKP